MNDNTVGSVIYTARIDTSKLGSDAAKTEKIVDNVGDSADKSAARGEKSFLKMGAAIGIAAGVASTLLVKAVDSVTNSIGSAIKRVDTLNNSKRTFANMGFAVGDTDKAVKGLEKSIQGLPTSLDEGIRGVQMIAAATNDVQKSQKIFTALNNGILGFGGTAAQVSNAVQQLSQDLAGGKIQAETWNSLLDSGLGPALAAIARQMGMTTKDLKAGLSEGTISVETFTDSLIKMNEEGGGGMQSLQKIAKDSTSGISTGWANAQTAITRGVAKIIQAVGSENISGSISKIGTAMEKLLGSISKVVEFVVRNKDFIAPFAVAFGIILTLLIAYTAAVKTATIVQGIFNAVMAANPIGLLILGIAALVAGLVYFFTQTEIGQKIVKGFFEGFMAVAVPVFNWFKTVWSAIYQIISMPIGLAANYIIGQVSMIKNALTTLWNWTSGTFNKIGDIASAIFKKAVNFVLGFVENQFNGIVNTMNGAIAAIDKITPGSISPVDRISIPRLATGGIVMPTPGGTLANIAEAGKPEAVIPLDRLEDMIGSTGQKQGAPITIQVTGVFATSKNEQRRVAQQIAARLQELGIAKGQKVVYG